MGKKAPWHLWAVGILSLLWYGSGAYVIVLAQRGMWPGMEPDEAAYYAAQPGWFALLTDIGLATSILGSIALLMRKSWALSLFGVALVLILGNDAYDLAMGTSRAYANSDGRDRGRRRARSGLRQRDDQARGAWLGERLKAFGHVPPSGNRDCPGGRSARCS
jgi:hypothetical protein